MDEKNLVKYLKDQIKHYRKREKGVILSGETRGWFAGKAEAYEDVLNYLEMPYLDE